MADRIDIPAKGDKPKATWGAKVADMLNRHESALEEFGPGRPANLRERRAAPFPYECRVVASGDSAALAVFAPQGVLTIDGGAVDIDTATAMQGMESGWKTFEGVGVPDAGESSEVWLRVEFPEESESESEQELGGPPSSVAASPTAELVTGSGDGEEDGGNVQRILVVRITAHSGGGYKVEQFVRSSLHLAATGVTSLNEMRGDLEIVAGGEPVELEGMNLSLSVEKNNTAKQVIVSLEANEPEVDDDYCNAISDEGDGDGGGGDGGGMGWLDGFGDGGGGDGIQGSNEISKWPCDSGGNEGVTE